MTAFFGLTPRKLRKASQQSSEQQDRPWTRMMLLGLSMGFTWTELRSMEASRVADFVSEWADMRKPREEASADVVRDATPADVRALMSL